MRRTVYVIMALTLCVLLCGCGKSRQVKNVEEAISSLGTISLLSLDDIERAEKMYQELSDEEKQAVDNISDLTEARERHNYLVFIDGNMPFSHEWINSADGDVYFFECDGTGTHDNASCTYTRIEDELAIVVSEDGVENITLQLSVEGRDELITEAKRYPYVQVEDYEAAGAAVRAEVERCLLAHDDGFWFIANQFMYFGEDGVGIAFDSFERLEEGVHSPVKWEYIDNDTIRIEVSSSGGRYSVTGDFNIIDDTTRRPILLNHGSKTTACGYFIMKDELTGAG